LRRTPWSAAALLLPFAACRVSYSALDTASPEATRITNLHWLVLWVTGAVSFAVIAALAIALTGLLGIFYLVGSGWAPAAQRWTILARNLSLVALLIVWYRASAPTAPRPIRREAASH